MPTMWQTYPIEFTGGWRTDLGRLNQGIVAPGSATTLQNYEPAIEGGYRKLLGYTKYSDQPVPGTGRIIGVFIVDDVRCLALRAGKFWLGSGTDWEEVSDAGNSSAIKTKHISFNFDGTPTIGIVDGFSPPMYFNTVDETISVDSGAPADVVGASHIAEFKNHLFFGKGNILTFTAPYAPTNYEPGDGSGQINIGSDITGLIVFREQLIVFCKDKILRVEGNTVLDFTLQPITDNTGCLCPYTIKEVGGDIMYLGPDGIRWLSATQRNNDFGLERASKNIQREVLERVNTDCGYTSIVLSSKNQYRLFFYLNNVPRQSSEGVLTTLYTDQSVENVQWAKTVGFKVYTADHDQFRSQEIVLFSSDTDYIYRMEQGSSLDGEDIESIFETPYMPIDDPRVRKTVYKHDLYMQNQGAFDITVSVKYDFGKTDIIQPPSFNVSSVGGVGTIYGEPSSVYGVSLYSQVVPVEFRDNVIGSGFTVALNYYDKGTNPPHTIQHATLEFATNERR